MDSMRNTFIQNGEWSIYTHWPFKGPLFFGLDFDAKFFIYTEEGYGNGGFLEQPHFAPLIFYHLIIIFVLDSVFDFHWLFPLTITWKRD